MTSRLKWPAAPALAGIVILLILLAVVLGAPKAVRPGDVSTQAGALAQRASQLKADTSPSQVATAVGKQAPNDSIELLGAQGDVLAASGNRAGTAVADTVPVKELSALRVQSLKLSVPEAVTSPLSGGRVAVIILCAICLLLCLITLAVRTPWRAHRERLSPGMAEWSPPSMAAAPDAPAPEVTAAPQPAQRLQPPADGASDGVNGAAAERTRLVQEMIRLAELTSDERVVSRAIAVLGRVGVTTIEPAAGERYNPELHAVASLIVTNDPDLHDSVAAMIRRGYADHGRVLREADVELYGLPPNDPRRLA